MKRMKRDTSVQGSKLTVASKLDQIKPQMNSMYSSKNRTVWETNELRVILTSLLENIYY